MNSQKLSMKKTECYQKKNKNVEDIILFAFAGTQRRIVASPAPNESPKSPQLQLLTVSSSLFASKTYTWEGGVDDD